MEWLNYHHLLYFWVVAREGSIVRASRLLRLAQPTISGQIRALEEQFGEKLFARSGRNLVLTETGRTVYRYADEIFTLGRELQDTLRGRPTGRPVRLIVGISDAVPKLIAHRLIEPALHMPDPVRLICREDRPERLLADLSVHALDLVISDAPIGPAVKIRAFNHLLGETDVTLFATAELAQRHRNGFPESIHGAPFLIPSDNSTLGRSLEQWFDEIGIRPNIVGEFDDSALMKAFGEAGAGIFAAPSAIREEIMRQSQIEEVGRIEGISERYYAISVERKLKHPAVVAISTSARTKLFG